MGLLLIIIGIGIAIYLWSKKKRESAYDKGERKRHYWNRIHKDMYKELGEKEDKENDRTTNTVHRSNDRVEGKYDSKKTRGK